MTAAPSPVPPAEAAETACSRNDLHGIGFCVLGPLGNEPDEPFGGSVVRTGC